MAVARRTAVVAGAAKFFEATSARDGVVDRFDPAGPLRGAWIDYLSGVVRALARRGVTLPGAAIAVASTLPEGGGLSSSAALTVATARALASLAGARLTAEVIAEVAWEAEHDEVGVRCGRMDQVIGALAAPGKALWYDSTTRERRAIPFKGKLWIVDTGVRHRLTDGGYNQRRTECEEALRALRAQGWQLPSLSSFPIDRLPASLPPNLERRTAHVVTETARVGLAATALAQGDLRTLGRLMTESHLSLRDRFDASCEEADVLVEAATRLGAWGARLTGAGWGGNVIVLLDDRVAARVMVELQQQFARIYRRIPEVWSTRASAGVKREGVAGR